MVKDPIDFIKEMMKEVEREGINKVGDRIYWPWSEQYNNWISFYGPLTKNLNDFEKFNSIAYFRWVELQNILLWIWMNVIFGRYHSAIRELRYVLESFIQAYYLDFEHPKADIQCKLEILKEVEAVGARLIDKTDLENKQKIKFLYSELSKYVHSSYEELEPVIKEGKISTRITFAFERELFDKCEEFTHRVMDGIFFILLKRFTLFSKDAKDDQMLLDSLKKFKCEMTLNLLK